MNGRAQHGFTLLEVVVAFAILAMAVSTLLTMFASGMRNTALVHDYQRALLLAESRLSYLRGIPVQNLRPATDEGHESGGFTWRSEVSVVDEMPDEAGMRLYRLVVAASWREGERLRMVTLSSLRLGEAP